MTQVADTRFSFEHDRFWKPCAYFYYSETESMVMFSYPNKGERHELDINSLRTLFQIKAGSRDAALLDGIEIACPFTHRIWPGSSVPSPIVEGTSVWHVESDHAVATQNKIVAALNMALQKVDGRDFQPVSDDLQPDRKFEVQIEQRLKRLGFTESKMIHGQHQFQFFVDEFVYLEGLRAHFSNIIWILEKLNQARAAYAKDSRIVDYVQKIQMLTAPSLRSLRDKFHECDAILADVLKVLTDFEDMVKEVRTLRTELRTPLAYWDQMVKMWTLEGLPKEKGTKTLIRMSYETAQAQFDSQKARIAL